MLVSYSTAPSHQTHPDSGDPQEGRDERAGGRCTSCSYSWTSAVNTSHNDCIRFCRKPVHAGESPLEGDILGVSARAVLVEEVDRVLQSWGSDIWLQCK